MEITSSEIGVGILTYNRPDYYQQVITSVPRDKIGTLVVVNDGENNYATPQYDIDHIILNGRQLGVSKSKNILLQELIKRGCKHLFIIEDDILIKNSDVFKEYIRAASSTGIHHLCYEKVANNGNNLRFVLEQSDGVRVGFYSNPQGAFMYFNANLINKLGGFDENYTNAFEHIDFAYNLSQKNVAPPFWYFPDLLNSEEYLTDIPGSNDNSSISNRENYQVNWDRSAQYFVHKWGKFTTNIEDTESLPFIHKLIDLQKNYHRKKLINRGKKLSIIIPYRDRVPALQRVIPSLRDYVREQVEEYEILVIEQNNKDPFNKGLLNNVGFTLCSGDYVCFHDVDLLPEFADYSYPEKPSHISSHCSQFNYINIPDKIMGGVILFTREHFRQVNGYSNEYVGWGKEDDDLYERCVRENLAPYKHPFGKFFSVPHPHRLNGSQENEMHEINGKKFNSFRDDPDCVSYKQEGLSDCMAKIKNTSLRSSDNFKHYLINF
jgi:glycosyltransferase involved in cell wall biosynthesis